MSFSLPNPEDSIFLWLQVLRIILFNPSDNLPVGGLLLRAEKLKRTFALPAEAEAIDPQSLEGKNLVVDYYRLKYYIVYLATTMSVW